MSDDVLRFPDLGSAIVYLCGIRALSGTPNPGNLEAMKWKLLDHGWAVRISVPTKAGWYSAIAKFATPKTQQEMERGEWFGKKPDAAFDAFMSAPCEGTA
jgi:hypothetical protein